MFPSGTKALIGTKAAGCVHERHWAWSRFADQHMSNFPYTVDQKYHYALRMLRRRQPGQDEERDSFSSKSQSG